VYIAIGIMGATVMPHNLYPPFRSRSKPQAAKGHVVYSERHPLQYHRFGCRLSVAFSLLNAAILVLAANGIFWQAEHHRPEERCPIRPR
jgi:Mn2+/Fe2+ NRAMP family transporter